MNSLTDVDDSSTLNMARPGSICVNIEAIAADIIFRKGASYCRRTTGRNRQIP